MKRIPDDPSSHRTLVGLLTAAAAGFALLHLLAGLFPLSLVWGFHQQAFFPVGVNIAVVLMMFCLLLPKVQGVLLEGVGRMTARVTGAPLAAKAGVAAAAIAAGVLLFWFVREKLLLLGDGYLLVRTIPHVTGAEDPSFFRNEPVPIYLSWLIWRLLGDLHVAGADELAPRILSILSGAVSLPVVFFLSRSFTDEPVERALTALFVLAWGGLQLFFGYVENYALLAMGVLLLVWLLASSLRGKVSPVVPSVAYGLLFTVHFGMVCLLPVMGLLWWKSFRRGHWRSALASIGSAASVAALVLWMCGYNPEIFFNMFFRSPRHLIGVSGAGEDQGYGILSVWHALDLVNLEMLLTPFSLVTIAVLLALEKGRVSLKDEVLAALLLAAACGLLFTCGVSPDLGMSRDWDLLASFSLPLGPAAAYLLLRRISDPPVRQRILVMITGVMLLHTAGWVALNAREKESLARFQELPDGRLWGKHALKGAHEELAILYRGRMDAAGSIEQYAKYLAVDSTNPRIYASMGNSYRLIGDSQNEMRCLELAIQKGATYWDVFAELALLYASRGRTDEGLKTALQGCLLNPRSAGAAVAVGMLMEKRDGNCREAMTYYEHALEYDPRYAEAYYQEGMCYRQAGDLQDMAECLREFLRLAPDDPRASAVRSLVEQPFATP